MVHANGTGYEVEIFTLGGQTLNMITVEADQVHRVGPKEVMHARRIANNVSLTRFG